MVIVRIKDNGSGISEEIKWRIFDNLFTSKCVDKVMGIGLAIARQMIEENHGGRLSFNSTLGRPQQSFLLVFDYFSAITNIS